MREKGLLLILIFFLVASPAKSDSGHVVAKTRLNLRSCPSTSNCSVVETLAPKAELEVMRQDGMWFHVRVVPSGEIGWVHSSFVMPVASRDLETGIVPKLIHYFFPILLVGGTLFGLGYSGTVFRKGAEMKKVLVEMKAEVEKQGNQVNERWHSLVRQANRRIHLPVFFWGAVYAVAFFALSTKDFGLSLIGLALPTLGYFGFLIGPSFDATDFHIDF
jgi:hypothetical protein